MPKPQAASSEFTYAEEQLLLQNSIERVINTSIEIAENSTHEDSSISLEDWDDLKWLTVKLWNAARERVFVARQAKMEGKQ